MLLVLIVCILLFVYLILDVGCLCIGWVLILDRLWIMFCWCVGSVCVYFVVFVLVCCSWNFVFGLIVFYCIIC